MDKSLQEATISSERIYEGRVINLRVDTIQLPNARTGKREIIEHRGAVAIVPILGDDIVVMVRQFRSAAGEPLLEIPAGTREPNEDIAVCAAREMAEEINYRPRRVIKLFESYVAPGYSSELIHTFLALDLVPVEGHTDEDEFLEVIQMPLIEAIKLIAKGEIRDSKSISGLLYAARVLPDYREGS